MALVRNMPNAQFTPAGVLKLPLAASTNPAQLLAELKASILELSVEEPAVARS
jgi:hypothetical protein